MYGLWALLFLMLISSIPAIVVYVWFRIARYPFSPVRFLLSFLAGAAAFFPALILQKFFPGTVRAVSKWNLFVQIFIRIALTEELSRFMALLFFRCMTSRQDAGKAGKGEAPASVSYTELIQGSAIGLIAGLGFAVLENVAYGASYAGNVLLRVFTAAPLHGACGSRIGAAVMLFRRHPAAALFRFLTAVAIHGIYNFMVIMPGFPALAAILIAFSALISSILMIRGGMHTWKPMTKQ